MNKKLILLLLVLIMILGVFPMGAMASDAGTLSFSTDLKSEYTYSSGNPFQLTVVVGSYTPDGGSSTALPAGTTIKYQWYKSTDDKIDASDSKVGTQQNFGSSATAGINYYYVVATATIDGAEYTGTSNVTCVKVPATDKSVLVTVNNQGILATDKNGAAVGGKSVSVADVNCDNKQTVDEVLLAVHKTLLTADAYATSGSEGALTVTKIWNKETENFAVYLNGAKVTASVDTVEIKAKDVVCISLNSGENDKYVAFDTVATTVSENKEFTLTLKDGNGDAAVGLPVGLWVDGTFEQIGHKVTDENGQVTLSFVTAGSYMVTARATSEESPITAPACAVTVKEKGELRFYGSLPTTTQVCYVGEQLAFTIQKDGYYINNVRQNGVSNSAYTLTWYRIGADGQPQNLGTSIISNMTAADVGTWRYYAVLAGEIYGDQYYTMSDIVKVVVKEPTLPKGSAENGFVTGFASYTLGMDGLTFEEGKTDYELTEFDVGTNETLHFNYAGSGLWCGVRVNGIKSTTSDYELTHTLYATGSFKIPTTFAAGQTNVVSLLVGTKYDSNGSGTIDAKDDFDRYDVYNFTVTTLPGVAPITVKNSDNTNITLSDTINATKNYYLKETSGTRTADTVKLTANFKATNGVKLYVGSKLYSGALKNEELALSDFIDKDGVAKIPLKVIYLGELGKSYEHTVTLTLNPAPDFAAPVIKTQPVAESTVSKGGTVSLGVEVETPAEGTTLSYQWVKGNSSLSVTNNNYMVIDGATSASYDAPGEETVQDMYYFCLVTLRKGGASATTVSNAAKVTTELTYVNAPVITIQPGICGNKSGGGTYCTEYTAGSAFDPMWMAVASKADGHNEVTELGCAPFLSDVKCYYNTVPSTEGGILVDGTAALAGTGGSFGSYFSFTPTAGLPEGINYVYFVVTSTAADDPTKSASTTTDFVKLTYGKADFGFEGSGTEADPYLLKSGNDFVTIRKFVEELGINCSGICFKMADDITLPADWQSIGTNGAGGKFFGGTLDGDGHTLSFAKGSPSLIHHAKNATIKNLKIYGEEIQGPALISGSWINQTNGAWIAKISNVTLVSGSSTLESGLVNGSASTYNPITITNCTVEEGVTIGYDKKQNNIGSIAGGFIGSITNCRSAATVFGNNNVGGIVGISANSMGAGNLTNCVFTGNIVATGHSVGGIQGSGYVSDSAPNALCVCIQNCYVNAEISGKNNVGGMLGGDPGIMQAWDNGPGNIRNNLFYGKLTGETNVGGMVGYYASLNKYNVIEDNYFYDANGHKNILGSVTYIDTDSHEFGLGADGIFYFDTSRDNLDDIKEVVDAEDKGTPDWQYTSVSKRNHNRTDDIMGADKGTMGRTVTTDELTDGTVLDLLNNGKNSNKNWEQGKVCPEISNKAIVTALEISGKYKTEYYIGDELEMKGAMITAIWSNGNTTNLDIDDVTVEGFDNSKRAVLNLKLIYGSVSTEFQVKVLQPTGKIQVSFTLLGDTKHGDSGAVHTKVDDNLVTWLGEKKYTVDNNATVWDLLEFIAEKNEDVSFANPEGNYISAVTYKETRLGEFDNGTNSGWMYTLNGKHPELGVAEQFLNDGDVIIFHYTDDYTKETDDDPAVTAVMDMITDLPVAGKVLLTDKAVIEAARAAYDALNDEQKAMVGNYEELVKVEKAFAKVKAAADAAAAKAVEDKISAIGTVTPDSKDAIEAARAAYDALTDDQKALVPNYNTLTDAEAAYAELSKEKELPFKDITNHWAKGAINYMYQAGLMNGVSATEFAPDALLNRGMLVTILYRVEGEPAVTGTCDFTDVLADKYYYNAVLWAQSVGVVNGTSKTTFSPNADVTREQMVTILYRYAQYCGEDVSAKADFSGYTDASQISSYAMDAMAWAKAKGYISGRTATTLVPKGTATRAEVATVLMKYLSVE